MDAKRSDSARSTGDLVRDVIERDGVIKEGLARGLINVRALARYIQKTSRDRHSFESLVSAVRRYPVKASAAEYHRIGGLIRKLSLKNEIVAVTVRSSPDVPSWLAKFSGSVDYGRGETFRVVSGAESVSVVIDSHNLDKLKAVIPRSEIVRVLSDLSEIVVILSDEALRRVGVGATIFTELAVNHVNFLYVLSYGPPHAFALIVDRDAAMAGYRALERLREG